MNEQHFRVLVLIPAFNEAEKIAAVIERVRSAAPVADILVVNDGSSDRTVERAEQAGAKVVSHPFNMGYGVTIQTGYKYARARNYDFVVQIDGDGQHDPAYIPRLLEPINTGEADFVIGSRFLGEIAYTPSIARRTGMMLFRKIVTAVIQQPISDCTSGYQAFNRKVLDLFCRDIFPVDYPDADVLITLHRAELRISEVSVRMYANQEGRSMHNGFKPLYYVFKMLLSIVVTLMRNKQFYKGGR